jgi:hypothetical protein
VLGRLAAAREHERDQQQEAESPGHPSTATR